MATKFSINNKKRGSALAYVIILLMVISILSFSMSQIFNSNLKQTKYLQNSLEAYYLAYSGALIGYEALLANSNTKLDDLVRRNVTFTSTVDFDNGKSVISAKVSKEANFMDWIKITSTATLTGKGDTYTRVMYFKPSDPLNVLWESN